CNDHHKAWDSICNIYREAMSLELIWPYVESQPNPTIFYYLQAIINYRTAICTNCPLLKNAARRAFASIWSARHHPIYRLIEIADEEQLMRLHPTIYTQHQGLDAILEEVNKALKTLIPPVSQQRHWEIAARNCKKFLQ
ncbi:13626_t:CDS:2, partial [Rhizophagus irregularis]